MSYSAFIEESNDERRKELLASLREYIQKAGVERIDGLRPEEWRDGEGEEEKMEREREDSLLYKVKVRV